MATTRLEHLAGAATLAQALLLLSAISATDRVCAESRVEPTVDVTLTQTTNGNINGTGPSRSDTIVTGSAGVAVAITGTNSALRGQWAYRALHSVHGLQKDSLVPDGLLTFHTDVARQGIGLDASVQARQVQATVTGNNEQASSSQGRYTTTDWRLTPFVERALNAETAFVARLGRGLQQSSQTDASLSDRPDSHIRDDSVTLTRRPTPLGYSLARTWRSSTYVGQAEPVLSQEATKGSVRYAPSAEWELGALAGFERTRAFPARYVDHPYGAQAFWRPSERTQLATEVTQRFFGRGWDVSLNHRTPWMALGLRAERTPDAGLSSAGATGNAASVAELFDAMLSTRIPDAQERAKAVAALLSNRNIPSQLNGARDVYALNAQLRQSLSAQMAFMGRRHTWVNMVGMSKTKPLANDGDPVDDLLTTWRSTRQYYAESQLTHQLTQQNSLSGGLRWSRAQEWAPGNSTVSSHDVTLRMALQARLDLKTTATVGLRRVIGHNSANTNASEAALYMGLGHRF